MLKLLQTSSLEKVLPQTTCPAAEITGLSALRGETGLLSGGLLRK